MARKADALERGIQLYESGDLAGAEACLMQVDEDPARRGPAQTFLGRVYLKTGRPGDAEKALKQALAIRRTAEAYLLLGESLLHQNKPKQAEEAFLEASRRDGSSPEPCIMLGHALAAQERLPDAIRSYEQALLRDAQSTTARYYLAETLVQADDLPRAATQLHYLLQREPTYVPAILLMGDMAFYQEDYRQAIVEYCRAMDLEGVGGPIYERLGQAFNAISDFAQSLKAFEASIQEHPTHWPCYLEAARLCESGKWLRKARRYYQAIADVPEYQAEAAEAIARIDAHFAQFDLSEPAQDAPSPTERGFTPPETLDRGTGLLDPNHLPWAGASSTGKLDGWVSTSTGKLKDPGGEPQRPVQPPSSGRSILEATSELLPQGLKGLKGLFKRK